MLDAALVRIGTVIGKPPGWERVVRALAPPDRFSNAPLHRSPLDDGTVFPVDRGTLIGWSVHFFGTYEPEVRAALHSHLSPGDVAFDVGANVGWHTLLMASRVGTGGRVFAFEPNETTRARLLDAVQANAFSQVTVDARAVADSEGSRGFAAPDAGTVWDGTGRLTAVAGDRRVECVTLDRFVRERAIPKVSLIKIDVEGWEFAVLRGASEVMRRDRPALVFEYDPAYAGRSGGSGTSIGELLFAAGYRLFLLRAGRRPEPVTRLGGAGNYLAVFAGATP